MKILLLKEYKPYSLFELQQLFNKNKDEVDNILKSLSLLNFVKKISKDSSKIELEELLDIDSIDEFNNRIYDDIYVFKYVGILMIESICLILYPKYLDKYVDDSENNFKLIKQIVSVIRKYQSKEQKINLEEQYNLANFNLLSIALELISTYSEYGLYSSDMQVIEQNGEGNINWDKTINDGVAFLSQGVPIYLDTYTINQQNNEQDFFRRLHAFILSDGCNRLKELLGILDIECINISSERRENFGSKDSIIYSLNRELSTQFITYKQHILTLMLRYIQEDFSHKMSKSISFVGTNSFNLVWEDVCSVVMNNCIKKSIKELGLSNLNNYKESMLLCDVIKKPIWTHKESNSTHNAKKTLIPDIVTIQDNQLSIYDAKYYKIKLDCNEVKAQPGVEDITKQYLYELAFMSFAKENNLCISKNAFLMPTENDVEITLGTASIPLFNDLSDIHLHDIDVILKPSKEMFDKYLNR